MSEEQKYIYIVVSRTHSLLGKAIRILTRYSYNHVSLSFDEELFPLFSFARYYACRPFFGGFVEESWRRFLYLNKDVCIKLYVVPLSPEKFLYLRQAVKDMEAERESYRYDMRLALGLKGKGGRHFTCLSFMSHVLKEAEVLAMTEDFRSIKELCEFLQPFFQSEMKIFAKNKEQYPYGRDTFFTPNINLILIYLTFLFHLSAVR